MASVSTIRKTAPVAPPVTAAAVDAFFQDISRAIMGASQPKQAKVHNYFDEIPLAPPPSPVSFAIDSNGKTATKKYEKILSLSLE